MATSRALWPACFPEHISRCAEMHRPAASQDILGFWRTRLRQTKTLRELTLGPRDASKSLDPSPGIPPAARASPKWLEVRRKLASCWRRARFSTTRSAWVRKAERSAPRRLRNREPIVCLCTMASRAGQTRCSSQPPSENTRRGWRLGEGHRVVSPRWSQRPQPPPAAPVGPRLPRVQCPNADCVSSCRPRYGNARP